MELGALICMPRSPQCNVCPANNLCVARKQGSQDQLPNLAKPVKPTVRRFIAFVVERAGKFLVRQRPEGVVNAHLWEFPNVEVGARFCEPQHALAEFNALRITDPRSEKLERLCTIKHSITRYRITLDAYRAKLGRTRHTSPKLEGHWLTCRQRAKLAFTGAHKKILNQLGAPSAALARRKT